MASPRPSLTPTSYALLGLLAVKPWTTYELAQQMDRSLSRFWPRARSKVYEEPRKLVARGLARASEGAVGRRPRTVYAITPRGRRALARWLAQPGAGPVLESEQLLKVFFGDSGSRDDLLTTLHGLRTWAHDQTLVTIEVATAVLDGRSPFPQRDAVNQLVGGFLDQFHEMVDRWADWASGVVQTWPDEPAAAAVDRPAMEAALAAAVERAARFRAACPAPSRPAPAPAARVRSGGAPS